MACWYIFNGLEVCLEEKGDGTYTIPTSNLSLVGTHEAISMDMDYVVHTIDVLPKGYKWIPIRTSFSLLTNAQYRQVVRAEELLDWHLSNQYCGYCGGPMAFQTPISKRCTQCGQELWPRFSPAVIVLIEKEDTRQALLVKSLAFKKDFYGLVSGYVEFGENLEECLCREVWEETGLKVKNIQYFGSQAWPNPRTLMIGYTAKYDGGTLKLQASELKEGGWFSKENLPNIPSKPSISRQLIEWWYNKSKE